MKNEISKVLLDITATQERIEALEKTQRAKQNVLEIPTAGFGDTEGGKKMDEDFIIDALDKIRDFIVLENKKMKDELLKMHLEFTGKL